VAEVSHKSAAALDKLITAVKAVAEPEKFDASSMDAMCQFDMANTSHPIVVLRKALEQLISLFNEGLEDINMLTSARKETEQAISRMGQHIDKVSDINFDIHLKALNAVIKSTRLGDKGKAIEAIVNEMKELAEQSNSTIQSVTDIIQEIASASETINRSRQINDAETDSTGQLLKEGIESFSRACTTFKEQSRNTLELGQKLEVKISQARGNIDFFDQLLAVFRQHQGDLKEIDELLSPFADAAGEDWKEEEQNIIKRYTMQKEHDAHKLILSDNNAMTMETEPEKYQEMEDNNESDLDDNVELF
jgi:methyl-accepting chemotaxis protein